MPVGPLAQGGCEAQGRTVTKTARACWAELRATLHVWHQDVSALNLMGCLDQD